MNTAIPTPSYQSIALRYINHKLLLSKTANYKNEIRFQRAVNRLMELKKWLNQHGKYANQIAAFKMLKLYRNDMYDALPHPENKSYASCTETLKCIYE